MLSENFHFACSVIFQMQKQGDCFVLGTAAIKVGGPWQSIQARFVWVRLVGFFFPLNRKERVLQYASKQYCNLLAKKFPLFHLVVLH